ncbi:hypothetical protein CLU81_5472 [Flavobacterium sp. 9]|uniref:hypothetical protein n=1 Tax=Flavobacterium sp. 9 TaxID=2035198 RepID=UPI000C173CB9|nr:hypothetical protein [Flavobacterium sp. 9]PIF34807.1 hypothetical protein CLU81_5472 [Flavobacterium sp. 9]
MFQKLILILSLYFSAQIQSQNLVEDEGTIGNSISSQLYAKCFENINQGAEILEKYPAFKNTKLCSLMYCMMLLVYEDKEIQQIAEDRLIGIATQLYHEGIPVILTMGMDIYLEAEKRNQNLEDDDHIVYISYGECTNPRFLTQAAEIVNKQTMTLINQNKKQ